MHSTKCHRFNLKVYYAKLTYLNYIGRHVFSVLVKALGNIHFLKKKNFLRKTHSLMGSHNPSLGCFNNKDECIGFNFLL